VNIYQITPTTAAGPAGSSVNIIGSTTSPNASYQIILGRTIVASGISEGYYVNTNFTVPETPSGPYALILRDIPSDANATSRFSVSMGYNIAMAQPTVREGTPLTFNVSVTAGALDVNYYAKIDVVLPSGTIYTTNVDLGGINFKGTASKQVTFPSNNFSPSGGAIDYTGSYTIKFNDTLAQSRFIANILDLSTYNRGQSAKIQATSYQPNQPAVITFASANNIIETFRVTASAEGIISATWVVPWNIDMGSYTVKITPEGIQKQVEDQQTFTIQGHPVKVQVVNLAGRVVPNVSVRGTDSATGKIVTAESGSDGLAAFRFENGPHILTASWNGIDVGETSIVVRGAEVFTLCCQLTDTTISVKNSEGIVVPFVDLSISYRYQSGIISKSGNSSGRTDYTGNYTLISTLAGAIYTVDAMLYGQNFNVDNNTFSNHPDQVIAHVTIICPVENVTMNIIGYNSKAIPGARVEFVEVSNGLFYSATTNQEGTITTQATFGLYRVRIYNENILINETSMEVFKEIQNQIRCTLYGIQLSVVTVDFLGSPIPNVKIILNGPTRLSSTTKSNGMATFDNIIGGNMQIIAQPQGVADASQVMIVNVNKPDIVQMKIDKYVSIGGLFMQTSMFITIGIVAAVVLGFITVEIYRQKRIHTASHRAAT
jgi:hypothetical protein